MLVFVEPVQRYVACTDKRWRVEKSRRSDAQAFCMKSASKTCAQKASLAETLRGFHKFLEPV